MLLSSWASQTLRRRTFLRVAGSATATAGLALAGCQTDTPTPTTTPTYLLSADDNGQLNYLYLLKQLQAAFYKQVVAAPPSGLQADELAILTDLRDHEIIHSRSLSYIPSATAVLPILTFDFSSLNLTTRTNVLTTAQTFEDLCEAALNFTIPFLTAADTLTFLLRMASVEARHAATVRDLLAPGTLAARDAVLTAGSPLAAIAMPAAVIAALAPYFPTVIIDVSLLPIA